MGFMKLTENGTLNLTEYGFKQGDCIRVTCVGGGGGGSNANAYYDKQVRKPGYGGGEYITANNGDLSYHSCGDSGEIEIGVIKLGQDIKSIPITVGAGGNFRENGGSTSFGSYLTSLGGITNDGNAIREGAGYIPRVKSRNIDNSRMETDDISYTGAGVIILEW